MEYSKSNSTEQFEASKFKPHGRVEYVANSNWLYGTAIGPFNEELMAALAAMANVWFPAMATKGSWAHLATFQKSAMCAPVVLERLTRALSELTKMGVAPEATAFVFPPDVEGAVLMGPLYAQAFEKAGVRFGYFSRFEAAHAWAASLVPPPIE
jgi:hypothetical protein